VELHFLSVRRICSINLMLELKSIISVAFFGGIKPSLIVRLGSNSSIMR